jgi:ATP-dependent helicase/nuclease subunit B
MPRLLLTFPWDQPLLPQLVGHLTAGCTGQPWDLRDLLVVVPTQESGRRLRQGLALAAAERGTGVLAPTIVTPEGLLSGGLPPTTASDVAALAAWCEVLVQVDLDTVRAVLPSDPPRRDAAWAVAFAGQLMALQQQLGEHGLDFAAVARQVSGTAFEPERWEQLAQLEAGWTTVLAAHGLTGPSAAAIEHARGCAVPAGVSQVVVAGVLDPSPLSLLILERWAESVPVVVITHGPMDHPVTDEWGRPVMAALESRALPFSDRATIRVLRDTTAAAAAASQLAQEYAAQPQSLALGLVDPAASAALSLAFAKAGLRAHDPAGVPLSSHGIGLLALQLLHLVSDPRAAGVTQILRHPLFAAFATGERGWFTHGALMLQAWDELLTEHLPADLEAAVRFARAAPRLRALVPALEWLSDRRARLQRPGVALTLAEALAELGSAATSTVVDDEDVGTLRELLVEADETERRFPSFRPPAVAAALAAAMGRSRSFRLAEAEAWDLQGWLELGYETAPHLVLVGFNEGRVPETIHGDVFLPNALREALGLRGNRERFARDQLLLETLIRSRASAGRLDVLVPRMTDDAEPLQPSRLLFRCSDAELVGRARQLFNELPPPPAGAPRRVAWTLAPLPFTAPRHFSPSSIKAYLSCPFRYYLTHVLKAKAVEVGRREITAQAFGTLCHHALQRLGEDAGLRDVVDPRLLGEFLVQELERAARQQFGEADSFALKVQLESAKARLLAAAAVEAGERQAGWRIVQCEAEWSMNVRGIEFKGRIDRVDHQAETGRYRLIDYKTFDRDKTPEQAHWTRFRAEEAHVLPATVFEREGKAWRWTDLQLPLYLLASRPDYGDQVSAGYFILPKTKEETGLRTWDDLTPEHLQHAEQAAVAVAEAVAAGRFWPPAAKLAYEHPSDYLFPDDVERNVDGAAMQRLLKGAAPA